MTQELAEWYNKQANQAKVHGVEQYFTKQELGKERVYETTKEVLLSEWNNRV
jgi:hypothetical protein